MTKWYAHKTTIDGYTLDSQAEAARYQELKYMMLAGEITNLTVHPRYDLLPPATASDGSRLSKVTYIADFEYINDTGETIVEDVKGVETPIYRLKRNLFLRKYPHLRFMVVK